MEEVNKKYDNFKTFMGTIPGIDSTYITLLNQCSINVFFQGIAQHNDKNATELTNYMCEKGGINLSTITPEIQDKFARYLEYFRKINNVKI